MDDRKQVLIKTLNDCGRTVAGQIRQILAFSRSPEPKSHYWVDNVVFWIRNGSADRLPGRPNVLSLWQIERSAPIPLASGAASARRV